MAAGRQARMKAMIMAEDETARRAALAELLPLQQEDFAAGSSRRSSTSSSS